MNKFYDEILDPDEEVEHFQRRKDYHEENPYERYKKSNKD